MEQCPKILNFNSKTILTHQSPNTNPPYFETSYFSHYFAFFGVIYLGTLKAIEECPRNRNFQWTKCLVIDLSTYSPIAWHLSHIPCPKVWACIVYSWAWKKNLHLIGNRSFYLRSIKNMFWVKGQSKWLIAK